MNLHLAVVLDRWDTGCRLLPLESNQALDAVYAGAMVDFGILVCPKELIAVDFGTTPPHTASHCVPLDAHPCRKNRGQASVNQGKEPHPPTPSPGRFRVS